nr:PREDICTED: uncharacterized protein LOC103359624 [Stegastes partitus]
MEIVQQSSVKVPNSVIVSGLIGTEADEELFDFLKQSGSIVRIIPLDTPHLDTGKQAIVEYTYGTAVQSLSPLLPYKLPSKTHTDIFYHIDALSNVYTPVVSKTATQTYLTELRDIAKQTGRDFAAVLKEELSKISEAVDSDDTDVQIEHMEPDLPDAPDLQAPAQVSPQPSVVPEPMIQPQGWSLPLPSASAEKRTPALKLDVNPPELQRVIVEHIVRSEDTAAQVHTSFRLRPFSGRRPCPTNEVDYETWRSNVELLLKDVKQSNLHKSRKLLESLSSPAIDIVKHLSPESPPIVYLEILDSAFGTVEDGDDLFAKYLNTMQNHGEEPSAYLQRLQVMLNTTFRRGGIAAGDHDRQLLKQFVTTIPESFYRENLSHLPIHSLNDLLEVESANGQNVPYLGYVETAITFPKISLGVDIEVPTLALIVPDMRSSLSSLLIGTNALDILYEQYSDIALSNQHSLSYGYKVVLKTLEVRKRQCVDSSLGSLRLHSSDSEIIAAGETKVLEGSVACRMPNAGRWVMVESPKSTSLPGGLLVTDGLATLPSKLPRCIPVILKNESDHDITLTPKTVIAEIHAIQSVQSVDPQSAGPSTKPNHKSNLNFDFGSSPVPNEWKERITDKLNSMPEVFAQHDLDFGRTDKIKHHINLSDKTSFKHRARPIHPQDIQAVRDHLQQLLDAEVIRESESPFSSPIVVVKKKNGDVRLCIDYRKLNLQTVKDSYALPHLEESFSALNGSKWFSVLDLKSGFYQIEMEECDKHKTAFVCPLGFYEFNRMPQGITNAPSTFQRLMERCIGELNLKQALVFLDDLIVFSSTLEEHEERLLRVLSRLKEFGLKLSPEKCKFFQSSVKYLGHIISEDGIQTDPEKITALKTWPKPNTLKELRAFLGFCGYYRRFIKDYSKITKPLNQLTAGYPPLRKHTNPKADTGKYHSPKDPFGNRWTSCCQAAFDTIIEKLTTAPVLGFANPKCPYVLHTDASTSGLGAALYQEQEGQKRVIAYASRGLSKCEARYPAHKLEFLALKWAVTEKFQDYLYGSPFLVITDSNPLTYILTTAKLDATSYRWLAALSTFDFQLQYRAGKRNQDADGLSRRPHDTQPDDILSKKELERIQQFTQRHLLESDQPNLIDECAVKAICEKHLVHQLSDDGPGELVPTTSLVLSLSHHTKAIPESFQEEERLGGLPVIPHFTTSELRSKQQADACIREVLNQMESGERLLPSLRKELPELFLLLREWNRLVVQDGVLYRKRQEGTQTQYQLVLPDELRPLVLKGLHDDMGHMGVERTLDLVRRRFYWPKMSVDIESKVKTCNRCIRRKMPPEKAAPLVNITATRPLELVCMDFLTLEPDSRNIKDILVITDHFTKYAVAIPTSNQKAQTVARCLWDHFIVHYGIPERLHSDQGPDFESKTIKELCELAGIQKVRTTPYHPRGNPVERFNRTLLNMLGTLENHKKSHWREHVKPLVHAYNCTKNEVTGFTPYELMFGRQPRLPVDLAFGLPVAHQPGSHSQYVRNLKSHLETSYKVATETAKKTADRNKARFDKNVVDSTLERGDRVLVRNVRIRGKHKLADKWESDVYVVVRQPSGLPVYVVRPETKDGPLRTLHRDLLLPCGFLPATPIEAETSAKEKPRRPKTRQQTQTECSDSSERQETDSEDYDPPYLYDHRDVVVETTASYFPPETDKSLQRYVSEPLPVPTVEQDPTDSARALPEDVPVATAESDLPEPDPVETNSPEMDIEQHVSSDASPEIDNQSEEIRGDIHSSTPAEIEQRENNSDDSDSNTDHHLRRSTRHREPAQRLTYPELVLVSMEDTNFHQFLQTLFHS